MPKKTKKQKVLAQARRIIKDAQSYSNPKKTTEIKADDMPPKQEFKYSFQVSKAKENSNLSTLDTHYSSISKDILKIIVFAAVALAGEFILYFQFGG